jgi:hypothetical protein
MLYLVLKSEEMLTRIHHLTWRSPCGQQTEQKDRAWWWNKTYQISHHNKKREHHDSSHLPKTVDRFEMWHDELWALTSVFAHRRSIEAGRSRWDPHTLAGPIKVKVLIRDHGWASVQWLRGSFVRCDGLTQADVFFVFFFFFFLRRGRSSPVVYTPGEWIVVKR